jgi:hypothetical protein
MSDSRTKEEYYDQEVMPLVKQILDLCARRGISMLSVFDLPDEKQFDLHCTSSLSDETGELGCATLRAYRALGKPGHRHKAWVHWDDRTRALFPDA